MGHAALRWAARVGLTARDARGARPDRGYGAAGRWRGPGCPAIATWSTTWNYGPGWEDRLLAAYGIDPDPVRTRYYRLLWDLGP
jgi:hypothetical protein